MIAVSAEIEAWRAAFESFQKEAPSASSWMAPLRREAFERFADLGFPGLRDEEWRKTSVAPIARAVFSPAGRPAPGAAQLPPEVDAGHRLVWINGSLQPAAPGAGTLPAGVVAGALAASAPLAQGWLSRLADPQSRPFVALNTAFLAGGAFLCVPDGVELSEPVHVAFVTSGAGRTVAAHPRTLVILGRGASATLVESYTGEGAYLANAVTEIVLGEGASLEHVRLQREDRAAFHVGTTRALLARDARYASTAVALGAVLSRHDLDAVLDAPGACCDLNGLYVVSGARHADSHTTIDHARPDGTSRELYKGVLSGRSRGVFNGRIIVRPDAARTDSRQVNRNLLMSEEALVDTKPELQIHNNDVKCSHAATIGQLDEAALFYLRSRALDMDEARRLLVRAFVSDVVSRVASAPARGMLERELSL